MAACRLRCCVCGTRFYGRSDARYCCGGCRQRAYRARIALQNAAEPGYDQRVDATQLARQLRRRSRLARKQAILIRQSRHAVQRRSAATAREGAGWYVASGTPGRAPLDRQVREDRRLDDDLPEMKV